MSESRLETLEGMKLSNVFLDSLMQIMNHLKIEEVMSKNVHVLTPEKSMWHAKELMRLKKVSGIPIVNSEGRLVGIVSIEDIILALEGNYINEPIEKHMTRNVVCLKPSDNLKKAVECFERYGYGRFPVTDEKGRVVGIVAKEDVLKGLLQWFSTVYTHDERRSDVLESEYFYKSLLTGEPLDKRGADFVMEIGYTDINMAGVVAARLKEFLISKGMDEKLVRRIVIATYEAEANVVIHSGSNGVVYCFLGQDAIRVRVEDYGKGIENVDIAMREGFSTAPDHIRELGFGAGMGLPNMKRFSDKMVIVSEVGKGVVVEMLFYRDET